MVNVVKNPSLRFRGSDGENYPDWEDKALGDITTIIDKKVGDLDVVSHSITAGVGFVSQAQKWGQDISGEQRKKYLLIEQGDFAYNKGNSKRYPAGCAYLWKGEIDIGVPSVFIGFKVNNDIANDEFVSQFFVFNKHERSLRKYITSGARSDGLLNLNKKDFFKLEIFVPHPEEQKKIGGFLSAIDLRIGFLGAKHAEMVKYKKGLIQQIFTQKIRFKGDNGKDYPNWQERKLGDNFIFQTATSKSNYIQENGALKIVDMGAISETGSLIANKKTDCKLDMLSKNDLVMPKDDIGSGLIIGKVAIIEDDNKYICGDHVFKIEYSDDYIPYFVKVLFNANLNNRKIIRICQGSPILGLGKSNLEKVIFNIPIIEEQNKIAELLSAVDKCIETLQNQITQTQQFKKSLMQQMFV